MFFGQPGLVIPAAHIFYGIRIAHQPFVARKFQALGLTVRSAADSAAMNLRMATMQMAGMRLPPRVRTLPTLRRRLTVAVVPDPPRTVIIRHAGQNLGSSINETRPIQNQRV